MRRQICLALFWSGLFGFFVGAFGHATWQIAVEDAQVLAGVVQYPFKSPEYQARTALWAFANQISAVLLWLGISERVLSIAWSGFLSCLSFQALSLLTLVISRNVLPAIACPFLVHYSRLLESVGDVVYPVYLSGLHTHGILGLSYMVLTVGILSSGRRRLGAFLLGFAPAVHASWAVWTWGLVGIVWLISEHHKKFAMRKNAGAFLFGVLIAGISYSVQRFGFRDVPAVPGETAAAYWDAFTRLWDYHRRPLSWAEISSSRTFFLSVIGLGIGGWGLLRMRHSIPAGGVVLLRIFFLATGLGIFALLLHAVPLGKLPSAVALLMPGRWINLASFMTLPIFLGLLGSRRENGATQAVLAGFLLVVAIQAPFWVLKGLALFLVLFVASEFFSGVLRTSSRAGRRVAAAGRAAQAIVLPAMALSVLIHSWKAWPDSWRQMRDRENDPFFSSMAGGQGMVIASPAANMLQLRTRRPMLFSESKLDLVSYVPSIGPDLNRLLNVISNLDFLSPPMRPDAHIDGLRSMNFGWLGGRVKQTWESRDAAGWQAIRREFGATEVVTLADWRLQLPEAARNEEFALYRIPAGMEE